MWYTEHTYAAPGIYVVSYLEPNLNGGILNVPNSVETRFYVETGILVSPGVNYESPRFPTDPIFVCPLNRPYSFSTAAIDSVAEFYYKYSVLSKALKDKSAPIAGYTVPDNLTINESNGIVTWDTKFNGQFVAGMFWVMIRIDKYTKTDLHLGYVIRATQIIVEDSDSQIGIGSSVTDPNKKILVTDGHEKRVRVVLGDNEDVSKLAFEIYYSRGIKGNIVINQYDSAASGKKFRIALLTLKTTSNILADLPYTITLRGNSDYRTDISFLYLTKDMPLPEPEPEPVGLLDENSISVYPNPFYSELYVEGLPPTEAVLINTAGQVVMKLNLREGQPVSTANLPSGIYLLKTSDKSVYKLIHN